MEWRGPQIARMLRDATARGLRASAVVLQKEVHANLSKSGGGKQVFGRHAAPGQPPMTQTGHLRHSWQLGNRNAVMDQSKAKAVPTAIVRVGSNVKYAAIHEFGGFIHAKSKLLTVPLNEQAWKMLKDRGTVRGMPLRFVPARKGKADMNTVGYLVSTIALTKRGKHAKRKAALPKGAYMFVLKRRVWIPRRPYVRPAVKKVKPRVVAEMVNALRLIPGATIR